MSLIWWMWRCGMLCWLWPRQLLFGCDGLVVGLVLLMLFAEGEAVRKGCSTDEGEPSPLTLRFVLQVVSGVGLNAGACLAALCSLYDTI